MSEKHTPLSAEHAELGASFTDFGGWQMPLKYGSELAEHRAVREAAGLFDLSHMGEVYLEGPGAGAALNYALIGLFTGMAVGKAKYSLIVAEDGGIVDDLIVYRLGEERYLVVPNAGNAETVAGLLAERAAGFDVVVHDASAQTSLVAIQGPLAEEILLRTVPAAESDAITGMKYYAAAEVTVAGVPALVARTGYTGEDGFEIIVPNEQAAPLWRTLLAAGTDSGLIPCGLAARDSLRLEAGMPLYGNELRRDLDPFTAGMGRVAALASEVDFVGRSALEGFAAEGRGGAVGRRLVALRGLGRRAGRGGYPVTVDGAVIGEITSGQPSPTLGYPIAFAYVDAAHSEPGTRVNVDLRGKEEPFEVVSTPFYRRSV
ncbi:glycine cleavage system aminomethyltransferase GcvT [Mycetocola spongiae]|uniref:glycine cleavage system aminomethyltransferase GcvT n=1 Tax=Mycetocola spongiae TaxID=2859226 RepID=UPI001CF4C451|nr:glycine cleavage system aminomethyltransferase GcvT [Mycetocola spongiae]UCR88262.1 glycine cleavage system aminomethyltransferase GcvT [Mycetocola spongiae]